MKLKKRERKEKKRIEYSYRVWEGIAYEKLSLPALISKKQKFGVCSVK